MSKEKNNSYLTRWQYSTLRMELGRTPLFREFRERYPSSVDSILRGKYSSKIHKWSKFQADIGESKQRKRIWTRERIIKKFERIRDKLKVTPTYRQFERFGRAALEAIKNGLYDVKIISYNEFLFDRGEYVKVRWDKPKIERVYYNLKEELGRSPTFTEFKDKSTGAMDSIREGRYSSTVKSWKGFLICLGEETVSGPDWNNKTLDEAYDSLRNELKRAPTAAEFSNRYSTGAFTAVIRGKYNPSIRSWNEFILYKGDTPNRVRGKSSAIPLLESILEGDATW